MKEMHFTNVEEFKKLFNIAPDMICIAGSDGYFKYLNPEWERTLDFSIEELLSTPYLELIHPDDRDKTLKEIEIQLKGGITINFENRYLCKDGTYKYFEWRGAQAESEALYAVARDITKRKQAKEELKEKKLQLEIIAEASNTGLWDWDLKTDKVFFSSEWKKQIGYADHEISNDYFEWQKRVHPDDLEKTVAKVRGFIEKSYPDYENEFRFQHKDGSYRWILAKASLLYDEQGKPIRMLGSHLDITRLKQVELELKQHKENLEEMVLERTKDLHTVINAMAGREVRMAELKGVIRKLRDQLKEAGIRPVTDDSLNESD